MNAAPVLPLSRPPAHTRPPPPTHKRAQGQTFVAYVTAVNASEWELAGVGLRVELQAERGASSGGGGGGGKAVLLDTAATAAAAAGALGSLAPGDRRGYVVRHDVKELGPHTLTCSSVYTTPDGERRFLPQASAQRVGTGGIVGWEGWLGEWRHTHQPMHTRSCYRYFASPWPTL